MALRHERFQTRLTGGSLVRLYKRAAAKHGGHAPPEARLIMGMAGAVCKCLLAARVSTARLLRCRLRSGQSSVSNRNLDLFIHHIQTCSLDLADHRIDPVRNGDYLDLQLGLYLSCRASRSISMPRASRMPIVGIPTAPIAVSLLPL